MSDKIIEITNLSKSYIIRHQKGERYTALRDVITRNVKGLWQKKSEKKDTIEEFWALKDVNIEIKQGDRVGIIGRNGAGKSTLLKILSRITEPTHGRITLRGRVASLLEVGTGFHPELSGRENIFLNGAILGMGRAEIRRKFDEIVAFAEVEKFLDTPVKRYSSGMYVRLAFAVAAHLEPEIMVIDEVLAVGDIQFQKKCLGKMEQVSQSEGRTVLFVSHNMPSIMSLCNKGILLTKGMVTTEGPILQVVKKYMEGQQDQKGGNWLRKESVFDDVNFTIHRMAIVDKQEQVINAYTYNDQEIGILMEFEIPELVPNLKVGFHFYDGQDNLLFTSFINGEAPETRFQAGMNRFVGTVPLNDLVEGEYKICLHASMYHQRWICHPPINSPEVYLKVLEMPKDLPFWSDREKGFFQPHIEYQKIH